MTIPLFYPQKYQEEWLSMLAEVFESRWLGQGPMVDRFEKEFGEKFGYGHCLAVNSGTSALELAYHLIGIGPGDEVVTTVFTCTATNIPLLRRGAKIVFTDVNDDLTMDYDDFYRKVNNSRNTKAIVAVTLGGLALDKRVSMLAEDLGIPLVVDAAQSLGVSEFAGDYICYSFQAIKHFSCGDGGMLVINDLEQYERAKKLRWFGIDREAKKRAGWNCSVNHQVAMEIEEPGYKMHMNDIAAAMGIVGLRHSDEILDWRRQLCEAYEDSIPGYLSLVYGGSCWLFCIITENRDSLMDFLRGRGVECDLVQLRNDIFKVFGGKKQNLPNMNRLDEQYLYLPLHCNMTMGDVDYICRLVREWVGSPTVLTHTAR